ADRIVVELPGITDPQQAIDTLKQTGLLEFVDIGNNSIPAGRQIRTDCEDPSKVDCGNPTGQLLTDTIQLTGTPAPTGTPAATAVTTGTAAAGAATPAATVTATSTQTSTANLPYFHTVMTGVAIQNATVTNSSLNQWVINFSLTASGSTIFANHT